MKVLVTSVRDYVKCTKNCYPNPTNKYTKNVQNLLLQIMEN
jgi:hypothetical protein